MKSVICSRSRGSPLDLGERLVRLRVRLGGQLAGALESEQADVGELAMSLIAAPRLAELLVAAGDVEDVVDDLEQDAELVGEAPIRNCVSVRPARPGSAATPTLAAIRRPVFSPWSWRRRSASSSATRRHVHVLAADHAVDAGRAEQLARGPRARGPGSPLLLAR